MSKSLMLYHFSRDRARLAIVLFSCMLAAVGCNAAPPNTGSAPTSESPSAEAQPAPSANATNPTPTNPTAATATATATALNPGEYCFTAKTETLDASAKVSVQSEGRVTGTANGVIQNPAEGYNSSYTKTFEGTLQGDRLTLNTVLQIENDTQNRQENWTISETTLNTGKDTYTKADCASLGNSAAVQTSTKPATDSDDSVASSTQPNANAAPAGEATLIEFETGESSATLEGSVIRGTRNTYVFGAQQGQALKLHISSPENNAVFDVIAPNGTVVEQEATHAEFALPATGDYQIVVGGTRGNATYEFNIEIQ